MMLVAQGIFRITGGYFLRAMVMVYGCFLWVIYGYVMLYSHPRGMVTSWVIIIN